LNSAVTSSVSIPPGLAIAQPLPDLLAPVKIRRGVVGFLRNNPTVAIGAALLLCLVLIGIFAPYLGTVDPTALAPAKRTRPPGFPAASETSALPGRPTMAATNARRRAITAHHQYDPTSSMVR